MTDYEIADLFLNTAATAGTLFMTLVSIMTGFLIVGLFFGQLPDRVMTGILVAGYSVLFLVATLQVNRVYTTFSNLGIEIRRRAENGAGLEWHAAVHSPEWIFTFGPYVSTGLLILGYLGTLIFFFRTRGLDPGDLR